MESKIRKLANKVNGKVYEHYSGRGMFGDDCMGVICSDINKCLLQAGNLCLKNVRTDNMGLDYIVYFPSIKSTKKEEAEEWKQNYKI